MFRDDESMHVAVSAALYLCIVTPAVCVRLLTQDLPLDEAFALEADQLLIRMGRNYAPDEHTQPGEATDTVHRTQLMDFISKCIDES